MVAAEVDAETCTLALRRLPSQFQGKQKIRDLICALATPWQAVLDALSQLLTERTIDAAVGAQLDVLGRLVGQPRTTPDDDVYRVYVRARIATNRSLGRAQDEIRIARLVIHDDAAQVVLDNQGAAAFVVRWLGTVADPAVAAILLAFLQEGAAAGVRVVVEYLAALDSDTMFTAISTFLVGAHLTGATTLVVDETTGFPASGSLVIDAGLAVEETVTYTGVLATKFLGVSALAHDHVDRSAVSRSDGPGRGLGDEANGATGGKLAAAKALN